MTSINLRSLPHIFARVQSERNNVEMGRDLRGLRRLILNSKLN